MRELWIHAGMPKSGSSALQVFLAKNSEKLKAEDLDYIELSDINDAKNGQISSGNAALFARSLLNENHEAFYNDTDDLQSKLYLLISNSSSEKILLSSEFFAVVPPNKIEKLKNDLLKKNIVLKFIYYVRRQDQFLMSSYMQRVKRHGCTDYPEDYILSNYKNIHFLKYYGYANLYVDVLGRENLYAFIYESTNKHPKGLVGHFVEKILGFCPDWITVQKSVNTSPSPLEVKFILSSNSYNPRMMFTDFIIEDSILKGRSAEYINHNIVSNEVVREVINYFNEQNKKFCEEFTENDVFPEAEVRDFVNLKELIFSSEELMEIVAGLLVRYDKRLSRLESN
ncbi:hypothetical protein JX580_05125 [Thiomicrospira microaerophila]|uniref:hypothetical protein n=1 Tax=Thiomicrospira microaerophila TaxID=406020 RepID=UPI00200E2ACF|nr:hypothetical protein [Thiomicrospira microaerophila]UQB43259.1 hypothetical protein JX580_05125 [Thiomicrospira microaerophila]